MSWSLILKYSGKCPNLSKLILGEHLFPQQPKATTTPIRWTDDDEAKTNRAIPTSNYGAEEDWQGLLLFKILIF